MLKKFNYILYCCCLFLGQLSYSQDINTSNLEEEKISDLQELFAKAYAKRNFSKSILICTVIIKKGTEQNNSEAVIFGYTNKGYSYLAIDEEELAGKSFLNAYKKAKAIEDEQSLASIFSNLAVYHYEYGKHIDSVFIYFDKSHSLLEQYQDTSKIVASYLNTTYIALEYDSLKIAKNNLNVINRYFKKSNKNYKKRAAFKNYVSGRYYAAIGDYKKSNTDLLAALEINKANGSVSNNSSIHLTYSENLYQQKQYKEAYKQRKIYEDYLEKELATENNSKQELEEKQEELNEYQNEIEIAEALNKHQAKDLMFKNKIIVLFIIIGLLLIGLILSLLKITKNRNRLVTLLKAKNNDYYKAKQRSEKLSKEKNTFFSTVSHELRTPLYGVIGITDMLLGNEGIQKFSKELMDLKYSANYLLTLVNNVLHINKIDARRDKAPENSFELRPYLKIMMTSVEYIKNENIYNLNIDNAIPKQLTGPSIQLKQILINLISNAFKFTEKGTIDINVTLEKEVEKTVYINFEVKDTGKGIPLDKQNAIFKDFVQLDEDSIGYKGTGLGLSIVKKLLKSLDATLILESAEEKGSAFSFTLPFVTQKETVAIKSATSKPNQAYLAEKTILVAEDNKINQMITKRMLENKGAKVHIANNGQEAIAIAHENAFDLILMDVNMPVLNGIESTKEILKFQDTPILALTAVVVDEMREQIINSGMLDIIHKPFDMKVFEEIVKRHIKTSINIT